MPSQYLMQIVNRETGDVVTYSPGSHVEQDFIEDCVKRIIESVQVLPKFDLAQFVDLCTKSIVDRGVGLGRTSNHVAQDVRDGMFESIIRSGVDSDVSDVISGIEKCVRGAIQSSIHELKSEIIP